MYYKITDKESKVFKSCHELDEKIKRIDKENITKVEEFTGLKYAQRLGGFGFSLTFRITGIIPVDNSVYGDEWKRDTNYPGVIIPNRKTKRGKEIEKFFKDLESVFYTEIYDALYLPDSGSSRFKIPNIVGNKNIVLIFLDDQFNPQNDGLIEITRTEYLKLHSEL